MSDARQAVGAATAVYAAAARRFHWITAAFVFILAPVGLYMVHRGETTNFDALTNSLYSWHKLGGFILLWIVAARLAYRLVKGAPPDDPALEPWRRTVAHLNHWSLYGLLILVPMLGWYATSLYPALTVVGGITLPSIATPDQKAAEQVYFLHKLGAILLVAVALAHIGAALFHHVVRKDNVLRRMLPGLRPR